MNQPVLPKLFDSLSELPRAVAESGSFLWRYQQITNKAKPGDGSPIICVSGYGGGDLSMQAMRRLLNKVGYDAREAAIGTNRESRDNLIQSIDDAIVFRKEMGQRLQERLYKIHHKTQQPVTLIGWSMGGLLAFDVAKNNADMASRVITMGSPFGNPRETIAFELLRRLNKSDVAIDVQDFATWDTLKNTDNLNVPVDVIISETDGIVSPSACHLGKHPLVKTHWVKSSHIGFSINPDTLHLITTLLAKASNTNAA